MSKCENCYHNKICINGAHYRNAEECRQYRDESFIIELPCRVGDEVYIMINESEKFGGSYVKGERVVEISTTGRIWTDNCYYDSDDVGKTVFLTREEAEEALKERENMDNIKKYIVSATADIKLTVETSMPEDIRQLLESALMDVCDILAAVRDISIEEQGALSEYFKSRLYEQFTGGKG